MTLSIDPGQVRAVLLDDGWHATPGFTLHTSSGLLKGSAFSFRDPSSGELIYAPLSSIRAIRAPEQLTEQQRAAARREQEERARALWEWQHFTDPATYAAIADAQNGLCPECGARLAEYAITHYLDGRILCQACSPLEHRYGTPA